MRDFIKHDSCWISETRHVSSNVSEYRTVTVESCLITIP